MMGHHPKRFELFTETNLEALLPPENFYRKLEGKLDLSFVRDLVRDLYDERVGGRSTRGLFQANSPMLDLVRWLRFRWHLRPQVATDDKAYATLEHIKGLDDGIKANVPLPSWSRRPGFYCQKVFTLRRFHLRGIEKVNMEGMMIVSGQNLKRLICTSATGPAPRPPALLTFCALCAPAHAFTSCTLRR